MFQVSKIDQMILTLEYQVCQELSWAFREILGTAGVRGMLSLSSFKK